MIRASDLVGRAVVTLSDATKVGHVDDVLFDPEMRQVIGFRVKVGQFSQMEAVARADVTSVGRDALTVSSTAAVNREDRLPALASSKTLGQATGTKVISEGGDLVGTVAAIELDDDGRAVMAYVLAAPLWDRLRHRESVISAQRIVRLGEGGIMIVPQAVADSFRPQKGS